MRIFIIGYMGAGKSTTGKKIAMNLKYQFIDLDEYIEEYYGRSINQIFKEDGEEKFREYESESLRKISESDNFVLATGGGTPCFNDNMSLMNNKGQTIYLKANVDLLVSRLLNSNEIRPLIEGKTEDELPKFISINLEEREEYYLRSEFVFNANNTNIEDISKLIL